jgi:Domain of unknown function (DUF3854)
MTTTKEPAPPANGNRPSSQTTSAAQSSRIAPRHLAMLAASGITPEHAERRGYETVNDTRKLAERGITFPRAVTERGAGLLVPMLDKRGSTWGYQFRPENPRERSGKTVKYETPPKQRNGFDIPPGVGPQLDDPTIPLFITEGVKKADCATAHGLAAIALPGVWSWRGTNPSGGKTAVADFNDVAWNGREVILAFDGDVARKESVQKALRALADFVGTKGARVKFLHLPDTDEKTGLDDYLMGGHTVDDVWSLVKSSLPPTSSVTADPQEPEPAPEPAVEPVPLIYLHERYRHWLGEHYDLDAIDVSLCVAAVEKLNGDPLWVLILSGSGMAKSETVVPISGCRGAIMVSSITSEGALLSMTSNKDRAAAATGGMLRELGSRGIVVIKDVTTILSMSGDRRDGVLSAFREIYDGRWDRRAGVDGGVVATWEGRIAVLGAVTTAWDAAHAVIAKCGDRFLLLRVDSARERLAVADSALRVIGRESEMRDELKKLAAGVIAGVDAGVQVELDVKEQRALIEAADLVTRCRTAVERDYQSNPVMAHAPEAPTRFVKQLAQVMRGAIAIGHTRIGALRLALRVARDSMPPLRLQIVNHLAQESQQTTTDVRRALQKPHNTVDRELQAMQLLGVVTCDEEQQFGDFGNELKPRWRWSLADWVDVDVLTVPEVFPSSAPPTYKGETASADALNFSYVRVAEIGNGLCGCGSRLLSPGSIARGFCERCRLDNKETA